VGQIRALVYAFAEREGLAYANLISAGARARVFEGELDAQRTVADVMVYPARAEVMATMRPRAERTWSRTNTSSAKMTVQGLRSGG
jgi:hypothetical protein